jgi:GNAT superfamily N-acetyltransferase
MPPVGHADVAPVLDRLVAGLSPRRLRMVVAQVDGLLAGWLTLVGDPHPLIAHVGTVHHVQTRAERRGRGVGSALMRYVATVARDEMDLEQLRLSARSGLGLEGFYGRLGWKEVGRWPRGLRVAPGDDRDDVLMSLTL